MSSRKGSAFALGALFAASASGAATAQTYIAYLAPAAPVVAAPVSIEAPPAPSSIVTVLIGAPTVAAPVAAPSTIAAPFTFVSPAGWSKQEVGDGRLRNLQAELMVGALRCRAMGIDVLTDYNGFVDAARGTLGVANAELKARFTAVYGRAAGEEAYDKFTTALANAFGSAATTREICAAISTSARAAAAGGASRTALLAIADQERLASGLPQLDGTVELASR